MSTLIKHSPTLLFTVDAWCKLQAFLSLSTQEISGFGRVVPFGNDFLVNEIFLLPQKVSPVETIIDELDVACFISELIEKGEDPYFIRLWWHSHVNMGLFWSQTDNENMKAHTKDYMFGLVGLQNGQVKIRLDINEPVKITLDDIPSQVMYLTEDYIAECQEEIREKVSQKPPPRSNRHSRKNSSAAVLVRALPDQDEECLQDLDDLDDFRLSLQNSMLYED